MIIDKGERRRRKSGWGGVMSKEEKSGWGGVMSEEEGSMVL